METPKTPNPKLPDDLIIEIFARLTVKSLLTLKCVCRSWLSLISSNQFVETHLKRSKKDSNFTHHRIMLNCRGHLKQCSASSLLREPLIDAFDWDYSVNPSRDSVWVGGSCDGLVCLTVDRKDHILWNPSTRTYKKLPDFGAKVNFGNYFACGLGFDKSSNDYKVVGFLCGGLTVMVKIYSVKTGQWKRIENFKGGRPMGDPAVFAHGKLYWIASKFKSGWDIVSLDLETEQYGILQEPSYVESGYFSRLVVCEGSLYVLCSRVTCADIWLMNQEGEGEGSWTKVVKIPHVDDLMKYPYFNRALYVLKNGEVMLLCGSSFVIFDSKDCSFRYPKIRNSVDVVAASSYMESLVSPFGLDCMSTAPY